MTFVILSSSRGTVLQSVIDRMKDKTLTATCAGLISDSEDHGCVEKARAAGLRVTIVSMHKDEARESYDKRIHAAILALMPPPPSPPPPRGRGANPPKAESGEGATLVACMGWMWMLSPWFVTQWKNRIVNVHPALLPKHPGVHAHDLVLKAGDKESGMSIHLIDEGMDTGKILLQKKCPVLPDDTVDTLKKRVQLLECEWYPKALQLIEKGELKLPS